MYYSYIEIEYVATNFSPARTDLALKLLMQLIQYWGQSSFSMVITNNFIGKDVSYSLDGYKSMGFVLVLSTQDKEQTISLRTIKPIPMAVYDTPTMWVSFHRISH
jgi:hypothetical protein